MNQYNQRNMQFCQLSYAVVFAIMFCFVSIGVYKKAMTTYSDTVYEQRHLDGTYKTAIGPAITTPQGVIPGIQATINITGKHVTYEMDLGYGKAPIENGVIIARKGPLVVISLEGQGLYRIPHNRVYRQQGLNQIVENLGAVYTKTSPNSLVRADSAPVFDKIMSRILLAPPSYDGYVLGSKLGKYSDLECKHYPEAHSKSDIKGGPVIWSPAETVCSPLHPTHSSYGDFKVVAEELIYRADTLVQISECMDNQNIFSGEAVEKVFDIGPDFSGSLHFGKNVKTGVSRACLSIKAKDVSVINGKYPAAR